MVRHLTEVLPVMPAPQWVLNHIQPIAVHDVLYYLLGASPRFPCSPHVSHRIGSTSSRPCPGKSPADPLPSDPNWAGRAVYTDERTAHSTAPVTDLWHVVITIGGDNGWYSTPILWAIRGWIDKLVGGVGLARGRRSSTTVHVGDAIDFWRVEAVTEGTLLRLRAEMKVPGHAWLEMRCEPHDTGSTYTQRAVFFPAASPAACTGGRFTPSMGSCSLGCKTGLLRSLNSAQHAPNKRCDTRVVCPRFASSRVACPRVRTSLVACGP